MSHFQEATPPSSPAELARLTAQLDARSPALGSDFRAHAMIKSGTTTVNIRGNEITSSTKKVDSYQASPQVPAGHVAVPGLGTTTIAAAIAGGLLPEGWKTGDASPFDFAGGAQAGSLPAISSASPATPLADSAALDAEADNDDLDSITRKTAVELASKALADVDNSLGADAVTTLLQSAADTGRIPDMDSLPDGVSEEAVGRIHAGFVAQADAALSSVGASVAGLSETLTDEELRVARAATINGDNDHLRALGQISLQRLAALPSANPDRFNDLIEGLPEDERKALRYDDTRGAWLIDHPTAGTMTFGAAVNLGIVRFG